MAKPVEPKHISGIEPPLPLQNETRPAPAKQSATIARAEKSGKAAPLSKPALPAPPTAPRGIHKSLGSQMASFVDSMEARRQGTMASNLKKLEMVSEEQTRLQQKKVAAMTEYAERLRTEDSWGRLKDVAHCLSSATSMLIGGAMIASGDPEIMGTGFTLGASGLMGLASGSMDSKSESLGIAGTLALASSGLGIASTLGPIYNDPGSSAQYVLAITQSATHLGEGLGLYSQGESAAMRASIEQQASRVEYDLAVSDRTATEIIRDTEVAVKRFDTSAVIDGMRDYQRVVSQIAASPAA